MKLSVRLPRIRGLQSLQGFTHIAFVSAALLASPVSQAENLAEIFAKAQRNDPTIREAEANMLATMQSKPIARSSLLPQIDGSANWNNQRNDGSSNRPSTICISGCDLPTGDPGRVEQPTTVNVDTETDVDTLSWSIDLRQPIINLNSWRQLKRAGKQAVQAEIDYRTTEQDLIIRVAEAYFNVLAAQDTLASEQAAKKAIGRQLEQAERRFEVGLIAITDVKESQAAFDDAVALEIAARRSLATAKEALREITGESPPPLAEPGEEFPLVKPDPQLEQDWVDISLQQNLALESSKIQTEITRENLRIARANHAPSLDFVASYGDFTQEGDSTTSGVFSDIDTDQTRKQFGVQFSIPIFSGGGVSADVKEKVYLHRAARENFEKVARSTEREARDAYLGVIAEIARVRALARSVESNQTALEATEAGYDVGTRTTVDVLNARDSLFRAETQYARSKYDYLVNVLKLKQAAGTLNAADVTDINNWLSDEPAAAAAVN